MSIEPSTPHPIRVGFIGFGEAGQAFASGWAQSGVGVKIDAFDIKTDHHATYVEYGVTGGATPSDAVAHADAVFSMVTADQAATAARSVAPYLAQGAFFFDCNSCAPDTKRAAAKVIDAAGGRYVDTAVMAPVHPKLNKTPLLLAGPHATDAMAIATTLGLSADVVSDKVGNASAIKMMRSVMIKGLEALTLECLLAARKAGVDEQVLASLDGSFPNWDWASKASYNFERTTTHGIRRAAEMREVAKTLSDLGLNNPMSSAIVEWQQAMGDLNLTLNTPEFTTNADTILTALKEQAI